VRLRQIQQLLDAVDFLAQRPLYDTDGQGQPRLGNLISFKELLATLKDIPGLKGPILSLLDSPLYGTTQNVVTVSGKVFPAIQGAADQVVLGGSALKELLPSVVGEMDNGLSIAVKLPEPADLQDLTGVLEDLEQAITQVVVNPTIEGQVKVSGWEKGSYWIDIYLGSAAAVYLIGGLAWSAAVVFKKIQEGRIFMQYVRGLETKDRMLENFEAAQGEFVARLIDLEARGVEDRNFKEHDNERVERLKNTIRTFSDLMQRGAEIHPALNAPEEIGNAFPPMGKLSELVSQVKLLESGNVAGEAAPKAPDTPDAPVVQE
jgi:hypothetical protein